MTAKKMADIFFGKFSELISKEKLELKDEKIDDNKKEPLIAKKSNTKIYVYSLATIITLIIIGYFLY